MMKRGLILVAFLLCLVGLLTKPAFSSLPSFSLFSNPFNITQANRWLDQLAMNFALEDSSAQSLSESLATLTKLRDQADDCVNISQKHIDSTEKLLVDAKVESQAPNDSLTSLQKYLKSKKDELTLNKSECKLFYLRATEVISVLNSSMETINKETLLKAKPTGITTIGNVFVLAKQLRQINLGDLVNKSDLPSFSQFSIIVLVLLMLASSLIAYWLISSINKKCLHKTARSFPDKLSMALILSLAHYAFLILFSLTFSTFVFIFSFYTPGSTYLNFIGLGLLGYTFSIFITHLLFHPFQGSICLVDISKRISEPLATRIKLLLALTLLGYFAYLLSSIHELPSIIVSLTRTFFITFYAIGLISILWLINRLPKLFHRRQGVRTLISCLLTLSLLVIIVMEWDGYQHLVTYILQGIALTLTFGFIAVLSHKVIGFTLDYLAIDQSSWLRDARQALGFHRPQAILQFIWLKYVFFLFIWGFFVIILFKVWGMSAASVQLTLSRFVNGFKIAGLDIIPLRILSAMIFFILASLIIRWLKHFLENRKATIDKGTQQALAAIVGYLGAAVIFLFSLLIAGVNFAGLAIVAGALSVGIGFGLQNIVNNFVSGIILLIERPIKPGDRILVGAIEGFVKKISIRSTQIQTLMLSDLIVPNSEIISGQVTNLMFHNNYGRVDIRIGVSYGSNTELVRNLLESIAKAHPEVINNDPQYMPSILLNDFGDSSMVFEMYCVIRDVNLKYTVASDLRLAIDKAFRENKIVIAFPQRVIHFYDEGFPAKIMDKHKS